MLLLFNHSGKWIVEVNTLMVGPQVVDLLPEDGAPEVLADKLQQV